MFGLSFHNPSCKYVIAFISQNLRIFLGLMIFKLQNYSFISSETLRNGRKSREMRSILSHPRRLPIEHVDGQVFSCVFLGTFDEFRLRSWYARNRLGI